MGKKRGQYKTGSKKRSVIKESDQGFHQQRVHVYPDELDVINNYRKFFNEGRRLDVDPSSIKYAWIPNRDENGDKMNFMVHNPIYKNPEEKEEEERQQEFIKELVSSLSEHSPRYDKIKRTPSEDGHCLVLDPADVHVGKLCDSFEVGEEYNSQIAVKRCLDGVDGIIQKSNGFSIDKIYFIGGNDILHVDTPGNTTTGGTKQDASDMWYRSFLMAKQLYVDILEKLIAIADVHFVFNPSNHDYMSGFMLAECIQTHFRKCKNITFDCSIAHRKYFNYGNSLIGTTHGDGAKQQDLGSLMSIEAKEDWAYSEHRYFFTHHIHHKVQKDYINVCVESLRSPSPADSWHSKKGYVNKPAIEGFIMSKEKGQVARLTNYF